MKRKSLQTFLIGNYYCTISQIQPDVESSKRYHVRARAYFGEVLEEITKICLSVEELISFLKRVKYA